MDVEKGMGLARRDGMVVAGIHYWQVTMGEGLRGREVVVGKGNGPCHIIRDRASGAS